MKSPGRILRRSRRGRNNSSITASSRNWSTKVSSPGCGVRILSASWEGNLRMTLILNNDDVKQVLTMEITMSALDQAYRELSRHEAVCRPRIDVQIPTPDPKKIYQWGTMEGGSTSGYFAIRMKSDVIYEQEYHGAITQEKYCVLPGKFCGLILLNSIQNGEPLALINDGYLQHMRVGADSGIGAK